ncbi:MAG: ISAs1 family transposase [Bacteroidota bacterium]
MDLLTSLAQIEDPRVDRNKLHNLPDILMISLCACICGAEDYEDFHLYGKKKIALLSQFLSLPHGIPSSATFRRVFNAMDPGAFSSVLSQWTQAVLSSVNLQGTVVSFDGKTLGGSAGHASQPRALQIVTAWSEAFQLSLGQLAVDQKSNEIKAIPLPLKTLDITGAIVTVDAINTQKDIAQVIRGKQAHYIMAVKHNQGFFAE